MSHVHSIMWASLRKNNKRKVIQVAEGFSLVQVWSRLQVCYYFMDKYISHLGKVNVALSKTILEQGFIVCEADLHIYLNVVR